MRYDRLAAAFVLSLGIAACEPGKGTITDGTTFKGCANLSAYAVPTSEFTGSLESSDCVVAVVGSQQKRGDVYRFTLNAATNVRFFLVSNSADLDPYLYLYRENGELISENNDNAAGGTLNSRIDANLSAGTYYIVASANSTAGVGSYSLMSIVM